MGENGKFVQVSQLNRSSLPIQVAEEEPRPTGAWEQDVRPSPL